MRWRCLGIGAAQLGNEDEAVTGPKPYGISKRMVLEAYRRVRANRGAAGIDGESRRLVECIVNVCANIKALFRGVIRQIKIPNRIARLILNRQEIEGRERLALVVDPTAS